jgi:deoxyribodipyrimidine photo-lyase
MEIAICWLRRDLRLHDNAALYHALKSGLPVLPMFVFDTHILDKLDDKTDRRIGFIHQALQNIKTELNAMQADIYVHHGTPHDALQAINQKYTIKKVFTNHDFEPYAHVRDNTIQEYLNANAATLHTSKDHVIFEKNEVTKPDGKPYTVFTPYSKRWKATWTPYYTQAYPCKRYYASFLKQSQHAMPSLDSMGFACNNNHFPSLTIPHAILKNYTENRDLPGIRGTSQLGVHLRFGTISIRQLATEAQALNETYLNELIWRDFYQQILHHFPHCVTGAFKPNYNAIVWSDNEQHFAAWCSGNTGVPIVDAGMRELNATGFMHNRVRMIVANYLTKILFINWQWGEAYFAKKLLDFDLAANNGGWQWAAGTGSDAAPYFRIFNPQLQTERFDPQHNYIKKWVPEYQEFGYAKPLVDFKTGRDASLKKYALYLKG